MKIIHTRINKFNIEKVESEIVGLIKQGFFGMSATENVLSNINMMVCDYLQDYIEQNQLCWYNVKSEFKSYLKVFIEYKTDETSPKKVICIRL